MRFNISFAGIRKAGQVKYLTVLSSFRIHLNISDNLVNAVF